MNTEKTDLIRKLQQDILPLQGIRPAKAGSAVDLGLGILELAFPNKCFPTGAIHEFLSESPETVAATTGFVGGLLSAFMRQRGACIWIGANQHIFPPSLQYFNLDPDRIIFVDAQKEKDQLWAMEEALKCEGLAAVVGEIPQLTFTASRRLQLAVEKSRVTGFLLRSRVRHLSATAAVARWRISPLPSIVEDGMPGPGFPRWNIELLKVRNGHPGQWEMNWDAGGFRLVEQSVPELTEMPQRKIG